MHKFFFFIILELAFIYNFFLYLNSFFLIDYDFFIICIKFIIDLFNQNDEILHLNYMLYTDTKRLTRKRLRLKQHTLTTIRKKNDPSKLDIKNSANL